MRDFRFPFAIGTMFGITVGVVIYMGKYYTLLEEFTTYQIQGSKQPFCINQSGQTFGERLFNTGKANQGENIK